MKQTRIYSISRGYRKVEVWIGSRMTGSRIGIETCTPAKGLSHKERHAVIASWLYSVHQIPGPAYQEGR